MGIKKDNNIRRTKRIFEDSNNQIDEALNGCPFKEKKCFDCEVQDCPEETEI